MSEDIGAYSSYDYKKGYDQAIEDAIKALNSIKCHEINCYEFSCSQCRDMALRSLKNE